MKPAIQLSRLEQTVFYALDKAIKTYRQYAQRSIREHELDITVDQWLVLKTIHDDPELTQREIADRVFKDYASITRIIELLVQRNYLTRAFHKQDRRRYRLELTVPGKKLHEKLVPVVYEYRETALSGIPGEEIRVLHRTLAKLTDNCTRN